MKLSKSIGLLMLAGVALVGCEDQGSNSSALGNVPSKAPSSAIGEATLSWEAPTTTTAGSPLMNLSGYRIYYGRVESKLTQTVNINTVGMQTYVIDNLPSGTWFFAIKAVTSSGAESAFSDIVSKTIG